MLKRCIDAVRNERNPQLSIEIVIVSNAAEHSVLSVINSYRDITHLRLRENIGFGPAANFGAANATSKFLVFLNDDAYPTPGALVALRDAAAVAPRRIIGSQIVSPGLGAP